MSNNDDNPRRSRDRPEDNPFIAFRRFADSQVSSLLNTVFTLPATIANYNNIHQAREACLFSKADKAQCNKLRAIEDDIVGLRDEGRELYRVGDLQGVLKKSDELLRLDRHAEDLRKNIVGQSSSESTGESEKEIVQKVANKKGQEWGWDWSWGFPKPFDEDDQSSSSKSDGRPELAQFLVQTQDLYQRMEADAKELFGEEAWYHAMGKVERAINEHPAIRSLMGEQTWREFREALDQQSMEDETQAWQPRSGGFARRIPGAQPLALMSPANYSPSALEEDDEMKKSGVDWRAAYDELMRADQENSSMACPVRGRRAYPKRVPWMDEERNDEPSYEYSHDHEDQHDDPPTPKTKQGDFPRFPAESRRSDMCEAAREDEDLHEFLREQEQRGRHLGLRDCPRSGTTNQERDDIEKFLQEQEERSGLQLGIRDCPRPGTTSQDRDDINKFLQEQQEQNGLHLGLRDSAEPTAADQERHDTTRMLRELQEKILAGNRSSAQRDAADDNAPETELDAYDHVLAKPTSTLSIAVQPSILSTFTTTERTVAPDGSVTTKVVLKKRFADGGEESSETVHTQRGQESDPWKAVRKGFVAREKKKDEEVVKEKEGNVKKGGWFWSS